ncbi:carboxylate--amine ligase [Natronorubrum tibetense]|nr:carboxylate--amine ligase [Natronorubrum tibetense]
METISIVNDRMKLYDNAVEAEVPVPETWCIDEFDQWDDEFIIKSRYNLLTAEQVPSYQSNESGIEKGIVHVESGAKPNRNSIITEMNHKPIVQKYVRNDAQYVFGALYDDGEPQVTFQHRQIRGDSYTGGGGVYRESMYDPDLEAVGRRLLEHLDWHGIACIEFAKDSETGEYKLLEINPRFWQSLSCAVRAGADFPTYYWMQATGRTEAIDPGYVNGIRSHYLYGEICHLSSVLFDSSVLVDRPSLPIKTWKILSSCLMTPRFDVVHIDDPVPTVRSLRRVLRNRLMK